MTFNNTHIDPVPRPSEVSALRKLKRSCVEREAMEEESNLQDGPSRTTKDCEVTADRVNTIDSDGRHENDDWQSNKLRRIVTDENVTDATNNNDEVVSSSASYPSMPLLRYATKSLPTPPSSTVDNPNVTAEDLPDKDPSRECWADLSKCDLTECKSLINVLMKQMMDNCTDNVDKNGDKGDIDMKESMAIFVRKNILQRMNDCTERYEKEMKELQQELYDFNQQAMDAALVSSTSNEYLLGTKTSDKVDSSSAGMILSRMVSDKTSITTTKVPAKRKRKAEKPNPTPAASVAEDDTSALIKKKFNDKNHQKKFITTPSKNDVLGGRGNGPNKHEGNKKFRNLVQKFKIEYINAYTDRDKKSITLQIMNEIESNGGRFLKKHSIEHVVVWEEMDYNSVLKKVGQALRENAPDIRSKKATQPVQLEAVSALMSLGS